MASFKSSNKIHSQMDRLHRYARGVTLGGEICLIRDTLMSLSLAVPLFKCWASYQFRCKCPELGICRLLNGHTKKKMETNACEVFSLPGFGQCLQKISLISISAVNEPLLSSNLHWATPNWFLLTIVNKTSHGLSTLLWQLSLSRNIVFILHFFAKAFIFLWFFVLNVHLQQSWFYDIFGIIHF